MDGNCWTDERKARLETLWRQGKSASLIANEIGVTRNAAIGKVRRMKLPSRQPTECLPGPRSANPRIRRRAVRAIAVKKAKPKIVAGRDYSCTIYELNDNSCRYPLWHTSATHAERRYCGCPGASVFSGVPYCERHSLVCGSSREN